MRAILDHFGGMLAPRWGHLGPSWGHGGMLGSCWCHGGPCWAMLGMEAMLSYVEAMLGPSWVQVGAVLGDVGGMWKPCGSYVGLAWAEDGLSYGFLQPLWAISTQDEAQNNQNHCETRHFLRLSWLSFFLLLPLAYSCSFLLSIPCLQIFSFFSFSEIFHLAFLLCRVAIVSSPHRSLRC